MIIMITFALRDRTNSMQQQMNTHIFPERQELVNELAERITTALRRSITSRNQASLAVSGGSTPVQLFRRLSIADIPWQKVIITLVDERWVDPSSPDSNEYLVRQHLLQNQAAVATFIGLKNTAPTAGEGEAECERHLRKISRSFTVLILGMGDDGHTASLFPGAEQLAAATDMNSGRTCMAVTPTAAPYERITLTLPAILEAGEIILHITGQKKKDVLEKAQAAGPPQDMPIRFIIRQEITPVTILWAP